MASSHVVALRVLKTERPCVDRQRGATDDRPGCAAEEPDGSVDAAPGAK